MGSFDGWLKGLDVLFAGDARLPQLRWLQASGARVTIAKTAEQARKAATGDPHAFDSAVVDADSKDFGWVSLARDVPRSCAVIVLSDRADGSLLQTVSALRADFVSKSATEADFVFKLKGTSRLSIGSMRRLSAHATKLWELSPQLGRLLHYNLWSYSDQEIADAMGLSRHTVQEYQEDLRRRTGVRTKHAYLRRLLEFAGEDPPLSMSEETQAYVLEGRKKLGTGERE
jgi:DNA-binding NarL/FixJ family response regulator